MYNEIVLSVEDVVRMRDVGVTPTYQYFINDLANAEAYIDSQIEKYSLKIVSTILNVLRSYCDDVREVRSTRTLKYIIKYTDDAWDVAKALERRYVFLSVSRI